MVIPTRQNSKAILIEGSQSKAILIKGSHRKAFLELWSLLIYNENGCCSQSFHGNATLSPSGQQYILANAVTLRLRSMADFEKTQRLDAPMMVKVDDEFRLFILDYGNHRIQIYKKDAVELSKEQIAPEMRNPILFTT